MNVFSKKACLRFLLCLGLTPFVACSTKVWRADDFDYQAIQGRGEAYFGKVIPEVSFGKNPTCRIEVGAYEALPKDWSTYELPMDGMVYFWGAAGRTSIHSISCYRNRNWMPKVVFTEQVPTFDNLGGGAVTYFGSLKVKIPDAEELPATRPGGPHRTLYETKDESESAWRTFNRQISDTAKLTLQKSVIRGMQ